MPEVTLEERFMPDGRWQIVSDFMNYHLSTVQMIGALERKLLSDPERFDRLLGYRFESMLFRRNDITGEVDYQDPVDQQRYSDEQAAREGHALLVGKWLNQ